MLLAGNMLLYHYPLTLLLIQCGDKRYIFYTDWN